MTAQAVQQSLQTAFEQWGRPEAIRFDNGKPWGNPHRRVPTSLALWLRGLGINVLFGRPRQSTDNAVVERCHGVLNAWVEPAICPDRIALRQRLDYFALLQRTRYPACQGGQTRQQAFPELTHRPRPYDRHLDRELWQMAPVVQFVARFTFTRKVEKTGRITLLTHEYALGRSFRGLLVTAQLDPVTCTWLIRGRDGELLQSFPALQLTYDTIASMRMTFRDFKGKLVGV